MPKQLRCLFSFGDDMKDLTELAQEYFENAQNIELQIKRKKAEINTSCFEHQFKLRHEIGMLKQMYHEQMEAYHKLKDYYNKK